MFTIVISEKGGAERRETFEKNEINVGRIQGNDLTLAKGNVSKHHARLLFRDGRFIVTDLKSTNGTYVNGRKIAQATIVRDGDKIYIGDFVLKLETGQGVQPPSPALPSNEGAVVNGGAAVVEDVPASRPGARTGGTAEAMQAVVAAQIVGPAAPPPALANGPAAPAGPTQAMDANMLLERDPEVMEKVAPVAPVPPERAAPAKAPGTRGGASPQAPRVRTTGSPHRTAEGRGVAAGAARAVVAPPPISSPRQLPRETAQQAARRLALITLVDRVADVLDLAPIEESFAIDDALSQRVERTIREQAKAMREEGEVSEGLDLEQLVRDALRELLALGPIGPLMEDEETLEIQALRHDYVLAVRANGPVLAEVSFTAEAALARAIRRLAHQAGEPLKPGEAIVQRRLPRGARMLAMSAPVSAGASTLVIRKRRRLEGSLEELVRSGGLSRPMASFLDHCLFARANILVVGAGVSAVGGAIAALAAAGPTGDRIAFVHEDEELTVPQGHVLSFPSPDDPLRRAELVRAVAQVGVDRLIVSAHGGGAAAATLEIIADGVEGVIAGIGAPSLRQGLARLVAHFGASRTGLALEMAREWVASSFDVALDVTRLSDGRLRVLRIAELSGIDSRGVGARDLFASTVEGNNGEGAFVASGVVPNMVNEFAARGVHVDPNLFKRSVGRS
jgi:pilus assembly protein CpaF